LKDQISGLEDQLRIIEDEQTCPIDLESYINKLNSSKKRIIVVNNILQGAQVSYQSFKVNGSLKMQSCIELISVEPNKILSKQLSTVSSLKH
jgi:hypothetical protein